MVLNCKDLSFFREECDVFLDINFSLKSGELLWLRGGNGSGKTTLIRILATLIQNFSGEILFNDMRIADCSRQYIDQIVYIGDKLSCFLGKTVLENLSFWANIRGTKALLLPALHVFNLNLIQDALFYKLSAGWKKRVSLARLLLFNVKIWLLDEPFINLDKKAKQMLLNLIEIRLNHGGMVIIASHEDFVLESNKIYKLDLD